MPLSAVNMIQNGHLIHQDVLQFVNLLTGVMADQPVLITNTVTTAGPSAAFLTRATPIGTGNYLSIAQSPGYTFTDDPHSGLYLDQFGEPGIMTNWQDGSNEGLPTMQFRGWKVDGATKDFGARMIIMPRSVGIGWTYNQASVTDTDGLIFFGNDSAQNVVALRSDQAYWGASFRIYGRYNKDDFNDRGYFEIDYISSAPSPTTNGGSVLLTTNARWGGGTRTPPDIDIAPSGALKLGSGSQLRWGLDPTDSSGGAAFHAFGNGVIGTPDFYTLSTLYTQSVTLQATSQPLTVMQVFGGKYAPTAGLGANGDWFFRGDTPGVTNQQIYQKVSGVWTPLTTGGGGGTTSILVYSAPAVTGLTVTLPQIPATNGVFEVSVNGQALMPTRDWTISGNVITFATALSADDVLVQYQVAPFNPAQVSNHYETTLAAGTSSFTLPAAPQGIPLLTRGGVVQYQSQGHYSISGAVVTLGVMVNGTEDGHFSVDYITGGGTDAGTVGGITPAQIMARANMLVNGGFEIWQRGNGPWSTGVMTADRWAITGTGLTVQRNFTITAGSPSSLQMDSSDATVKGIFQHFNATDYGDSFPGTYTFSAWVRCSTPNMVRLEMFGGSAAVSAYHPGDGAFHRLSATLVTGASVSTMDIHVRANAAGTAYVDNAMLVIGSTTPDFIPMHPADDLARCLRYYEVFQAATNAFMIAGGQILSTTLYYGFLPLLAQKSVTPTVTFAAPGLFSVVHGAGSQATLTAITTLPSSNQLRCVQVQGTSSGMTQGGGSLIGISGGAWITVEANP